MKEQVQPVLSNAEGLTNQIQNFHNGGRGQIMAENQGEVPKSPVKPEPKPTAKQKAEIVQVGEALKKVAETPGFQRQTERVAAETPKQEAVVARRKETGGIETYAQLGAEVTEEEERFSLQHPGDPQPTPDQLADPNFTQQFQRLQTIIGGLERRLEQFHDQSDIRSAYDELNRAIQNNEVPRVEADRYLNRITRLAREGERVRGVPEWLVEILHLPRGPERTEALKRVVGPLTPDLSQLPDELLQAFAEDEEAAEKFFDKIVSRPFYTPRSQYETGWYERMNLNSFLEKVRAVDEARFQAERGEYRNRGMPIPIELSPGRDTARYERFSSKRETAIRFHEMNRIVFVESGNLDAFVQMTRTVSPQNITDALTEVGVEEVRQLYDIAFGRLYAREDRVTTQNIREVQEWVGQKFRDWVDSGIVVNNAYNRPLEEWEIKRALAYGRNIGNAFFRNSGIIAMGHIPRREQQEWIKSFPSETVVRGIAGAKYLIYRLWMGREQGGKEFIEHWFKKLQKEKYDNRKVKLQKVGKVDIREDIIPAGAFDGGGFDKGWRTLWGYLDNKAMELTLPDPNTLSPENKRGREIIGVLREKFGLTMTMGKFLSKLEDEIKMRPGVMREVRLGGDVTQERIVNQPLYDKYMKEGLQAVLEQDKVHLGLGLLIAQSALTLPGKPEAPQELKATLWEKASEYLPLRLGYILAEDGEFHDNERNLHTTTGVTGLLENERFRQFRGEGGNLFSDDFETKLLLLQRKRIQQQERVGGDRAIPLDLSSFSEDERIFVKALQGLGKSNAFELAKVAWSDVPFLDDAPVGMVDADKFGDEVFPRRMGGDLSAFFQTNGELISIITNLNMPYKEVIGHLAKIVKELLPIPHDLPTGQDMVLPVFKTYLEFRRTNGWFPKYVPLAKEVLGMFKQPTSILQHFFGTGTAEQQTPSDGVQETSQNVQEAEFVGLIRRHKLPGEDDSQVDQLLKDLRAKWHFVVGADLLNLFLLVMVLGSFNFFKKVIEEK